VGYNRKKFVSHHEIVFRCIPQQKKTSSVAQWMKTFSVSSPQWKKNSSVVSHNRKNRFRCIPQRQKNVKLE
jgi:hypothetical protein